MEASRIQFACANPEKSQKTKEILTNIVSEVESKLEFERHSQPSYTLPQSYILPSEYQDFCGKI